MKHLLHGLSVSGPKLTNLAPGHVFGDILGDKTPPPWELRHLGWERLSDVRFPCHESDLRVKSTKHMHTYIDMYKYSTVQ